ncbi:hypothetical protein PG996_007017 [Apiospora saccharicola]|uniref:HMG box domain-containing protein n=1 Tax=Apiospora saccharicola TaxID=335842 RepID=A0ABR1V9M0_9PEZI
MADYWNQSAAAGQHNNIRALQLQSTWERLEQQLSLFCQVITFVPGVFETLDVATRDFLKQKMEAKYNCEAFYVADAGTLGRVFLAPTSAIHDEWMRICTPNKGQLPVIIDQGTAWAPGAPNMKNIQGQNLNQMIQESVHQAVHQAMQQSLQQLSISSPQTSPQKLAGGSGNHDGYDGSPKKRKLELTGYQGDDDSNYSDGGFVDTTSKYRKKTYASGGPRPPNSFMLYRKHVQKQVTAQNPGKKNSEISKIIGLQWRSLTDEEKEFWNDEQKKAAIKHKAMYPNYRYTPKHKNEKDDDKTPVKGKGKGKSTPKKLSIDTASQSSSQSSYELPPSPTWNKTAFGDIMSDQSLDQSVAPTGPTESFFDHALSQALSADADVPVVDYPVSTGADDGSGDAVKGTNKDFDSVTDESPADDAAKDADIYNGIFTFGAGSDGVSNEVEMGDNWDFGYIDIDAAMQSFDFTY